MQCQSGFTNTGEFCNRGPDTLALSSATCPAGYFQGLLGRCNKTCPAGYTNTGETCFRPVASLSFDNTTCRSGYFMGAIAGRCNQNCPSGYTNTGETCFRPVPSLGTDSMNCLANEERISILGVPRCYSKPVCPSGYSYFGLRCHVSPMATGTGGSVERTAVSTVVHHVKQGGNTHLWIVNRALALLSRSAQPGSALAGFLSTLDRNATVRQQWEQGLWDGDAADYVDFDGVGSSHNHQGTHFYNPVGRDRSGAGTSVLTYGGPLDNRFSCTNARQCAAFQLKYVVGRAIGDTASDGKAVAYHLGLALHYLTDMTQPMHTSG